MEPEISVFGEKVELFESVELGWTGPRERRELAKSGSEASREMAWCTCQRIAYMKVKTGTRIHLSSH